MHTLWKEHYKEWWCSCSKLDFAHSHPNHKFSRESLWVSHGTHNPLLAVLIHAPAQVENEEVTVFKALLDTCAKNKDLHRGAVVHDGISKRGLLAECSDALVTMYAKCGALTQAKELLDLHSSKSLLTWNALIAGLSRKGQGQHALCYFERMHHEGLCPDAATFACVLKSCGSIRAAAKGEQIHEEINKRGLLVNNVVLGNSLVNMYAKCGALSKARQVLEELPMRDVISWNALIGGYIQHDEDEQAIQCFDLMLREGLSPNAVTFISMFKACGNMRAAERGEKFHNKASRKGLLGNDVVLGTALLDMYVKCGALAKAHQVLEELAVRDVVSWNALIAGYVQQGEGEQALKCFQDMQRDGLLPDSVTLLCVLKACSSIDALEKGEAIHEEIAKQGLLQDNVMLGTALVDMYAKCGALAKAKQVLEGLPVRNAFSWSALIAGYAQQGEGELALNCFEGMQREGLFPDAVTFISVLKACGSIRAADKGEHVHREIDKLGLLENSISLGNALVDMYAKCGALGKARQVLVELPVRNVITWSAVITGYAELGEVDQALCCLEGMKREGLSPDAVTFICILKACGSIGAADKGEKIHDEIAKQGLLGDDVVLGTALVDMYAKCGALTKARQVLEELPTRDVVSWNALIAGSVQHGEAEEALSYFKQMKHDGLKPDATTYLGVLTACNRLGLIADAQIHFLEMSTSHSIEPSLEHYTCMIDLFGRAGYLDKAVEIIEKLPSCNSGVWSALLSACRKWGDVNVGRWAFEHGIQTDKFDAGFYVLMANIYTAAGMHEDAKSIKAMRIVNQAQKAQEDN